MSLTCVLCNLEFKNDDQLSQHVNGRKHKKFESLKEEREKSALRSVFISNLKKDTFVKQIEEHFEQFGKIVKVVTDPKKNSYAIVEFEDESSVEKTLAANEHKVGGRALKVSRREVKEFVSKTAASSQEAEKKEHLEKLRQEAVNVNTILGKCDSINDQVDKLIAYFKLTDEEVNKRETICNKLSDIFKQFWPEKEFKVSTFGSSKNGLACKGSDVDMTLLLESYLAENRLKQQVMPKIVVRQLKRSSQSNSKNSSSNNSNTTEMEQEDEQPQQIEEVSEHHVDNSSDATLKECVVKFFNNKEYDQLIKFDVEIQVKIVARIIQRFSTDIKSLKTITNARCPVVRFFNDTLNTNCDLTLNNYLACENTKLIRLYMDLEPNLERMIFVLRYWFKQKNLFGSASKFNTYTITFMIVFYMQMRKIGYLPTVEYLASLSDNRVEIHGWNCAFETDVENIKSSQPKEYEKCQEIDSSNFNDLLKGFFEFYSNFTFGSNDDEIYKVLSTRTARLLTGGESQLSKLSKYINVQDVFDLSHNLTANVSKSTVERFQSEARASNELLHYDIEPRKSASKGWGLILLTTKKALPIANQSNKNEKKSSKSISIGLEKNLNNKEEAQNVAKFVIHTLKECLLFSQISQDEVNLKKRKRAKLMSQICTQVDKLGIDQNKSPSKRQRTAELEGSPHDENNNEETSSEEETEQSDNSSSSGSPVKIGSFTLRAARNTWIGRRTLKRDLHKQNEELDEIKLERLCSEKLAEKNDHCSKEIDFRVDFVYDHGKINMRFALLDHLPSQLDLNDFDTLVHFLHVFTNTSMGKMFDQWLLKSN